MELTDEQIHLLKAALVARFQAVREEIREELLASDQAPYIELAGRVHDTGDASVADLLGDLGLATIDRHIDEIRAIDTALMRIAQGTYGVCVDCHGTIDIERLEVQPTALRCHDCQERWEETHVSKRGPTL